VRDPEVRRARPPRDALDGDRHRLLDSARELTPALVPSVVLGVGGSDVCHSPWKDGTFVSDRTMVEWIRKPDGSWAFDYSILDRYVELAGECGLADAVTCHTMVPWKNRVRYLEPEDSLASIRILKEDSADWKVTYAGKWHPELDDLLDDYCLMIDGSLSPDEIARRRRAGRTTTREAAPRRLGMRAA
jgi:hypothetical protein